MIVAIHQPEFLPWLGFFHKMSLSDTFVLLDTVQFEKNNFQNRNKVLIAGIPSWFTIPIEQHALEAKIKDIRINWTDEKLAKKHLTTIEQNYKKCPYFDEVFPFFQDLYTEKPALLADFNTKVILFFAHVLGLTTHIIRSSELPLSGEAQGGTEVTLEICKALGADVYVSGNGAKVYLDTRRYTDENVGVYFQEFSHPVYTQKNTKEFFSHLSVFDLICNEGENSLAIIKQGNIQKSEIYGKL